MKHLFLSAAIVFSVFSLTGCQSSSKETQGSSSHIDAKEQEKERLKVKKEARTIVSDFQKMFYQVGDLSFDSYNEVLEHYGLNKAQQENFISFIKENEVEGYVNNIMFNNQSEKIKKQADGNYVYLVTTEAVVTHLSESQNHYMTYKLEFKPTTLNQYKLISISYELGHSLEGVESKITKNSLDELLTEKLNDLFTHGLEMNKNNGEEVKEHLNSLFLSEDSATNIIERLDFASKAGYHLIESNLSLAEKQIDEDGFRAYGIGTYTLTYKDTSNKEKKKHYDIYMTLQQRNPLEKKYTYAIDTLTIKEK